MINIVSRRNAGLRAPIFMPNLVELPVTCVFFMDTKRSRCHNRDKCFQEMVQMQKAQTRYEEDNDICYNFLIGSDSNIYEGRGWYVRPALVKRYQTRGLQAESLLIGYFGNFNGEYPQILLDLTEQLLVFGVQNNFIKPKFLKVTLKH